MNTAGSARQRNRRGQGNLLRDDIVQAATELLADVDVGALSLRAVARAAGVTAPALYLHFADKTAVVDAVLRERFAALEERFDAAAAGLDDPAERLLTWGHTFVGFGLEHPGHFKVMYEGRDLADYRVGNGATIQDRVASDVAALMAAGRIPAADPTHVTLLLWQALHGVVALRISKPGVAWGPARDDTESIVRRMIGLPADDGPPVPRHGFVGRGTG